MIEFIIGLTVLQIGILASAIFVIASAAATDSIAWRITLLGAFVAALVYAFPPVLWWYPVAYIGVGILWTSVYTYIKVTHHAKILKKVVRDYQTKNNLPAGTITETVNQLVSIHSNDVPGYSVIEGIRNKYQESNQNLEVFRIYYLDNSVNISVTEDFKKKMQNMIIGYPMHALVIALGDIPAIIKNHLVKMFNQLITRHLKDVL